jgi:type VI secretion system ImpH/TssG family protein
MAPAPRPPSEHLSFLKRAGETARLWGLFPLVRGAEARAKNLPRVGRSRLPAQNIIDLSQDPSLGFSESTLTSVEIVKDRARVAGHWLGLIGPMGPLPIHLTEYASYEKRYAKTRPFGRFLDLVSGRMLQFFYRAWAESQPVALADRPDDDRFAEYIAKLTGATAGVSDRSVFPARARLHYAALFASRRSAIAIEDGLASLLRQPVRLIEYQPRWRDIEPDDRTALGQNYATLGMDAMLGAKVRSASDAFRIVVKAATARDYESFLPGGARFAIAAEALDAFAPSHLEWDIALEIDARKVQKAKLDGRSRLGWTSWVGRSPDAEVRCDAHLRKMTKPDRAKSAKGG